MVEKSVPVNQNKSCLVIDDEDDVRARLSAFIEKNGYNVLQAKMGYQAIDLYKEHKPDVVFLDVMLPDLDGMAVLKALKEFDPGAKVYFFTGIDGETFRSEAKKWGAAGHFVKPVRVHDLLKVLKEA